MSCTHPDTCFLFYRKEGHVQGREGAARWHQAGLGLLTLSLGPRARSTEGGSAGATPRHKPSSLVPVAPSSILRALGTLL